MYETSIDVERYRHPLVRDLAWLIAAPDLIATRCPGRPTLAELGLENATAWLDALEATPEPLESSVSASLSRRLGIYHERLWHFLLAHAPATHLLTHNLAIQDGNRTLGELDILYRHLPSATLVHLEVAIKFYLGLPAGPGGDMAQSRWIGAGGIDSLAIKHARLLEHQLPIAGHENAYAQLDIYRDAAQTALVQRLALPGVLFYPWQSDHAVPLLPPRGATPDHLRGHWLPWREWHAYRTAHDDTDAAQLQKPHWLAPPRREHFVTLDKLDAQLDTHFQAGHHALQLVISGRDDRQRRVMIVADHWPDCVPLPPRRQPRRRTTAGLSSLDPTVSYRV